MRIAKVDKIEDAYVCLLPYTILTGIIYTPLKKHIKEVFVGISDSSVSSSIYASRFGQCPPHDFTPDLGNLFLWVSFRDNSVKLVSELYDDPKIAEVLNKETLLDTVTINTNYEWSEPVNVIIGLDAIILIDQPDGHFEVQVRDLSSGTERSIIINEMKHKKRINMHYDNFFKEMETPQIRFRAKATPSHEMEVAVQFCTL